MAPTLWLWDECVNVYMHLLQKRDAVVCVAAGRRKSHFFNSFFFEKLFEPNGRDSYNYDQVRQWSNKINIADHDVFNLDKLFVPIHFGNNHWTLIVAFVQERRIQYYDSMGGAGVGYLEGLKQYFKDEAERTQKPNWEAIMDDWELFQGSTDTPQQNNSCDCGVFLCTTANYLAQNLRLTFGAADANHFRVRMTLELLRLTLLS